MFAICYLYIVDAVCNVPSSEYSNDKFQLVRIPGSSGCRTKYFDTLLRALTNDPRRIKAFEPTSNPKAIFTDVDTAMASWPNLNAALQDSESWVSGSVDECYPYPRGGMFYDDGGPNSVQACSAAASAVLQRFEPVLSDSSLHEMPPLVLFNFAAPSCRRMVPSDPRTDIECDHIPLRHPRIVEVTTSMHAKSFDRDHDVSWPLHPAPTFVAEADRALGGGSDAREAHLAMLAIEPDRCALEFSERPVKISFIGTATHRVRLALASALSSDDGGDIISRVWQPSSTVLRDDSELLNLTRAMGCNRESGDMATTVMACSQFVLAPRGHSLHSSRLLEAIASGAVPIVVSDGWVLPFEYEDIDWDSIVLRVSEAAVANVTRIARQVSYERWCSMVAAGQRAWLKHLGSIQGSLDTLHTVLKRRRCRVATTLQNNNNNINDKNEGSDGRRDILELPAGTSAVLLNIGSSLHPVLPASHARGVLSLAFEPLLQVAARIQPHDTLRVVPAAVSSFNGLRTMTAYNKDGM